MPKNKKEIATTLEKTAEQISVFIKEQKKLLSIEAVRLFYDIIDAYQLFDENANKEDSFDQDNDVLKLFKHIIDFSEITEFKFNQKIKALLEIKIRTNQISTAEKIILTEMIIANTSLRIENLRDKMDTDILIPDIKNRRGFLQKLEHTIEHHKREFNRVGKTNGNIGVIIYFDVDDFGEFNKDFGHDIGDQVLKKIGKFFGEKTRSTDTIARIGGDEFIVYLDDTTIEELSQRYKDKKKTPFESFLKSLSSLYVETQNGEKQITLSCGASNFEIDTLVDTDILIKKNMIKANKFLMQVAKKNKKRNQSTIALANGTIVKH